MLKCINGLCSFDPQTNINIGNVLFWSITVLVILLIFAKAYNDKNFRHERPIDLLKKLYIKGKITKKEFRKIKKDIED
jgi:putative membrane protein